MNIVFGLVLWSMKTCSLFFTSDIVATILRACDMKLYRKSNIFVGAVFIELILAFLSVIYIDEYSLIC